MEIPQCFYRISIKGLIFDETKEKFLLCQEENGMWELPGGGLDWGESPQAGLAREIKEEMGVEVLSVDETPSYFFTFQSAQSWMSNVIYVATITELHFVSSKECRDIKFFAPPEIESLHAFPNVKILAEMLAKKRGAVGN